MTATTVRPYITVETTQAAYRCIQLVSAEWGDQWLASLQRSMEQIDAGEGIRFEGDDDFFAALDAN